MNAFPVPCAGVILAGGRSSRMGSGYKALSNLAGRAMIEHVIERLRGQADPLWLSVAAVAPGFEALDLPLIADSVSSHRGPLAGLYSALKHLEAKGGSAWLLLCPCDAPFVPEDLGARLLDRAAGEEVAVAVAEYDGHRQPTFSVWNLSVLPAIEEALLKQGHGGLMQMLDILPHAVVEWRRDVIPPFFNVNTPADLVQAWRWLQD